MIRITKRGILRLLSYNIALIIVLALATYLGFQTAAKHRAALEQSYQKALGELTEYMADLDMSLNKGLYATSGKQLQNLSAQLLRQASCAKMALEQLPAADDAVYDTNKFLSQIGYFCESLARQIETDNHISDEQQQQLLTLSQISKSMTVRLGRLETSIQVGTLTVGKTAQATDNINPGSITWDDSVKEVGESLTEYPTLLYDGPFSDILEWKKPLMLEDGVFISVQQAMQEADAWLQKLNIDANLTEQSDQNCRLSCYRLSGGSVSCTITKVDGYIASLLDSRQINEANLSIDQALKIGEETMQIMGFSDICLSYYSLNNGVLTMSYALTQDGVVIYPDLIKLGIAMDNGQPVSMDSTAYLMNHNTRELPDPDISAAAAASSLSRLLTVKKAPRLALIPTDAGDELLCYEFYCDGVEEEVIVYINAATGDEERIFIVLRDENGTLVM